MDAARLIRTNPIKTRWSSYAFLLEQERLGLMLTHQQSSGALLASLWKANGTCM